MEHHTVSVCIPSRNRPVLLREAIQSCLVQTRKPDCIVVGDDSTNGDSEKMIADLAKETDIQIDYRRNSPPLGQNENTNSLFDRATSSHLVLLHDDDVLLPNAVEDLLSCWHEHPTLTAAYGKQYVMSHDGAIDLKGSIGLNSAYCRTPGRSGLQRNDWEVGLLQQFPNDGFMILTSVAQSTRWRPERDVGAGGEFDFGLRLGFTCQDFFFLDRYTMKYRVTKTVSLSNVISSDTALRSYLILEGFDISFLGKSIRTGEAIRRKRMAEMAPVAMMQSIRLGQRQQAWRIYCSSNHGWRRRVSLGGIRRLFQLLLSFVKS